MLVTKKNKVYDDDFPAVIKKKSRTKKPRHKFSMMHSIPVQTLNLTEGSFGGRRGKRLGFSVYTELTCKQCKPDRFFHKREGLRIHSSLQHSREWLQRSCIPNKSNTEPSSRPTRASTRTVKSTSAFESRQSKAPSKVADVEIIELEDEDVDEIVVVGAPLNGGDDNDIIPVVFDESNTDKGSIGDDDDDDIIECVEIVEGGDDHIKSFKPRNYKWMENSHLYQPQVWLLNSLNHQMKVTVESFSDDANEANDVLDDANDIVILDGSPVKRASSHIRNLFVDEESLSSKRTFDDASSSSCKRSRQEDEVELLMVEEDEKDRSSDNNDLMDIQSMLEVTMEEEYTDIETDSVMGEFEEKEIIEVDLDPEDSSEEDNDILCVDDQDNIVFDKTEVLADIDLAESNTETRRPKSIKDLVNQWACEEEALISKTSKVGKMKTKKSRKDLKPKPYHISE